MAVREFDPSPSSGSSLNYPAWQREYEAVLTESDTTTIFKLVEIAEAAALTRRADIDGNASHHAEYRAIEQALTRLTEIKRYRLRFL